MKVKMMRYLILAGLLLAPAFAFAQPAQSPTNPSNPSNQQAAVDGTNVVGTVRYCPNNVAVTYGSQTYAINTRVGVCGTPGYADTSASTGGGGGGGTQATPSVTTSYAGTPSACSASTVGTTATLILDSVANGTGRAGGGFALPATASAPVEFQWANGSSGLTTTPGGTVFQVLAGGQIPFSGAPSTQLYAISASSQAGSCQYLK